MKVNNSYILYYRSYLITDVCVKIDKYYEHNSSSRMFLPIGYNWYVIIFTIYLFMINIQELMHLVMILFLFSLHYIINENEVNCILPSTKNC